MKSFKQFLIEGIVNIPGRGNVFVPDSAPTPTQNAPPPQQTPARPQTPPVSQPPSAPRSVVDVDQKTGLNFNDLAEPVKDSKGNVTGYRIRANVGYDESRRPTVKGFHGPQNEVRIWKPGEGYQVFGTEQKLRAFAKSHGHQLPPGDLATLMQKGEIVIPAKPTGLASGPSPHQAISARYQTPGSPIQNFGRGARIVGGPLVAQAAGEILAPHVQKAGEELGIIDGIAKGISSVVPTNILAAGQSPAEEEREKQKQSDELKKMGFRSGRFRGPMGIDIGG